MNDLSSETCGIHVHWGCSQVAQAQKYFLEYFLGTGLVGIVEHFGLFEMRNGILKLVRDKQRGVVTR